MKYYKKTYIDKRRVKMKYIIYCEMKRKYYALLEIPKNVLIFDHIAIKKSKDCWIYDYIFIPQKYKNFKRSDKRWTEC